MTYKPESIEYLAKEWLEDTHIPFHPMNAVEIGQSPLNFGLVVGQTNQILVFVNDNDESRVNFNMSIRFSDEHVNITQHMNQQEYNEFVINVTDKMTSYGVDWQFQTQGERISGVVMNNFIDASEFSRNSFLQMVVRCQVVKAQILRTINFSLGNNNAPTETDNAPASSDSGTPTFYR